MSTVNAAVLFTTTLRPHRSANRRVLGWLLGLLAVAFAITGIGFSLIGAWPVMGFFGLDIALLVGAFYLNTRAGRAYEVIDLTAQQLSVRRVDPWGHERLWKFQPQWLQVNARPAATAPYGLDRLEVRSHGRTLVIGKFLTPEERLQLSDSLRLALAQITTSSAVAPPVSNT